MSLSFFPLFLNIHVTVNYYCKNIFTLITTTYSIESSYFNATIFIKYYYNILYPLNLIYLSTVFSSQLFLFLYKNCTLFIRSWTFDPESDDLIF